MLYFKRQIVHSFIYLSLSVILFLTTAVFALAADLSLSPSTGSYSVGQTFTVTVKAVPNSDTINAVESTVTYDPAVLSVVSVSKNGSAFSLWTAEPTFSNSAGTVTFGGGSPTPFKTTSTILSITFRTVTAGSATLGFKNSSVLAADGRGTDVFKNGTGATVTVTTATIPTPASEDLPIPKPEESTESDDSQAIIFGDPPRAPEIGSPIFLDPELWYNKTEGLFTWTLPFDVTGVAIEITTNPDNKPEEHKEAITESLVNEFAVTKDIVKDGEQYISINFKNQVGWGVATNRKLRIDTAAPEPFAINVQAGTSPSSFPLLRFVAKDITSGIDYYEMTVADKEPFRITPDEAQLGYLLKELEDGTYTVKVLSVDKAGNKRESSVAVLITAGWVKPVEVLEESSPWDFLTPINLFVFFLIVVIILQIIYFWYEHRTLKDREEKLRRETREIQDQMEKIFSALRDEVYDQVNAITKRKRLSTKEKETVESLTQALEVSETLIEKEINDVKVILM
jgi:hypothetical protein